MNRRPAAPIPMHWVGDAPTSLHGNGAGSFEHTTRNAAEVTCVLCTTLLRRLESTGREPQHAEFIELDGDMYSWYCTMCSRELGADLAERGGELDCPEHGREYVAWETWNVETDPSYPHDVISTNPAAGVDCG